MFSHIGNIFAPGPRQAEHSDTRQDIRRHDPDQERRRQKRKKAEDELFQDDHTASVSVTALRAFLENFLKSLKTSETAQPVDQTDITPPPQQGRQPSGQNAYAASAYQHVAEARAPKSSMLEGVDDTTAPAIQLDASEVRTIHTLLEDLKILQERKIEHIRIVRHESFLQSLVEAVHAIKNAPSFKV